MANTAEQPFVFAMYLLWGIICSCLFGVWDKVCTGKKINRLLSVAVDLVLGITISAATFVLNIYYNYGQFRLYYVVAFVFGWVIYRKFFKALLDKAVTALYNLFTFKKVNKDEQDFSE